MVEEKTAPGISYNALWLWFITILFVVVRFYMPTHPLSPQGSYEAFAHLFVGGLFVGGLFGAWLVSKRGLYLFLLVVMSIAELVAFLSS